MLEYANMSKMVGKSNLWFTNVKRAPKELVRLGIVRKESIKYHEQMRLENPVVLDPAAKITLSPKDNFKEIIFGGILGDDPPRARTEEELSKFLPYQRRNLGKEQMATNTAVLVAKRISEGTPFDKLMFQDTIEIPIREGEDVILPYRYLIENNKPILPEGLIEFLKRKRTF